MNYLSIDFLIVYAFLGITLLIGLRAGKNITNIRDYAIANKMYGTITLTLTFLATNIGGASTLDTASSIFSDGIIMMAASLGVVIQILIFAFFITPHMKYFNHCLTIGDVMGSFYGMSSKIIRTCLHK